VNAEPFFTLRLRDSVSLLQESDILFTTLYRDEPSTREKDTFYRTHFEKGSIISVETRKNAKTVAHARYRNGTLVEKIFDYDEDGFFEVTERYNQYGEIEKIAIDINKNKLFEYYELYDRDGKIVKNWDENEDGIPEIQYTQFPSGEAETVWQRRVSGQSVSVLYQNGAPAKLTIGSRAFQLIKEDSYPLYWLGKRPHFSDKIAEKLLQVFNESTASVESYTAIAGNDELYAVLEAVKNGKHKYMIAPSFTALDAVSQIVKGTNVLLGAQNMSTDEQGAHTGEVSVLQLKDLGVQVVILGHSERRHIYGDTDEMINKKVKLCLQFSNW